MRLLKALAVSVLLLSGASASAETSDWVKSESGRVRLISATKAVGTAPALRLGLQFQMEPGWKIYWRSPGDAGYPPRLDWTGSTNLGAPTINWPAPHRFVLAGLQNHGYMGEVVLPLDAPVPAPGQPVSLRAAVDFLACAQICVPQRAELSLDLPAGAAEPSAAAHDISRFSALVPGNGERHGLSLDKVEAVGDGESSILRLTITASTPLDAPDIFVEAEEVASFGQPSLTLSPDKRRAVLEAPVTPGTVLKPLAGNILRVTVTDGLRSMEAMVTPVVGGIAPAPDSASPVSLLAMIAVALLGGLILNLMPCVLPVLSIKVLGVLGHGGGERGHVRASFLASAAGITTSFLALAVLAIAVKQAGQAVGWGIQFQQPGFLAVMVVLLGLFAANLWGVFEISLPSWLMNSGGNSGAHHTILGHFMSGAFATVLATPCSAPFLGTAIGFALARGPLEILAIFAALGLGMASPFLAVAIWPDAALRMPRPGRWMITVRKLLALALAGTGLWLLSVLAVQTGFLAALISGGAVVAAIAILALKPHMPASSRSAVGVCVIALAGLALAAPFRMGDGGQASSSSGPIPWVAFDKTAISKQTADGKVVFVDVTADWCITCKVNKAAVVERGEVARRLSSPQVIAMKADWTKPDDGISRYLASFGRYGIPFNVVYGPAAPDGLPLSELLSEAEILTALDKAAGMSR